MGSAADGQCLQTRGPRKLVLCAEYGEGWGGEGSQTGSCYISRQAGFFSLNFAVFVHTPDSYS